MRIRRISNNEICKHFPNANYKMITHLTASVFGSPQRLFNSLMSNSIRISLLTLVCAFLCQCNQPAEETNAGSKETNSTVEKTATKVGVLLVSHGSHSETWRKMLTAIETDVSAEVLKSGKISGIKSAFMEYTEPSIATQLKAFDKEGYSDVVIIPILLTVSSHSFDDIPVIAGLRSSASTEEQLRSEKIAIYKAKADVVLTPLLDFTKVLKTNVVRRAKAMSKDAANEGVVLVGYGSEPYDKEWSILMDGLEKVVRDELKIEVLNYSWCGHIVRYKKEPTIKAIKATLEKKKKALVIPVLVAVDENFQGRIIGGAIEDVNEPDRIVYRHDAILPDADINQWVIDISREYAEKAHSRATK